MYKHTTVKKSLILLVAALLVVAVMLSACGTQPHKAVSIPTSATPESNGGIAVKYGEWIYYVNGYQSSASVENTYVDTTNAPRVGSVVRIEASKLEEAVGVSVEDGKTSTVKTKEIAEIVRKNAQIVIPRIYYTANGTTPELNGIWIFNNRIYILTPNDQLTAGGNTQTSQMVLMSYNLGGGDEQRHYTFESNSAQVWLYQNENETVMATYVLNSELHVLTVGANEKSSVDKLIADEDAEIKTVRSVNFDVSGGYVFYLDADGSICRLAKGSTQPTVLVKNDSKQGDTNTITYTIKFVSNGYVYYTVADTENSSIKDVVLYYTNQEVTGDSIGSVALDTSDITGMQGYNGKLIVVRARDDGYNGLYIVDSADGKTMKCLLQPGFNKKGITINKVVGNELFYTVDSVTYIKKLDGEIDATNFGTPYAYSWQTAASVGWAAPDIVTIGTTTYMFTLSSNSVSVVKFDADKKTNSTPATVLTLTAEEK